MKSYRNIRAALMMSAAVLVAAPAIAQEAAPAEVQVAPPPVAATLPQGGTATGAPSGESATPVDPEAAAQAAAEDAERRAEARTDRRAAPARAAVPVARRAAAAPVAAAGPAAAAPARTAAPAAAVPAATPPAAQQPARAEAAAPAPAPSAEKATTTTTTDEGGAPLWPLAVIAALIVAAGAFFFLRRRRAAEAEDYWAEPVQEETAYVEPAPEPVIEREPRFAPAAAAVAAPAAVAAVTPRHDPVPDVPAAPVAPEEISVARADRDDVAALTAADAPGDRPWLEFAMRPVRAGTNVDEALVEIELTVGNAGTVAAEDVRISTFMLSADHAGEMERLLLEPRDDAAVAPMTIGAGEGTRVDATLAMNRAALGGGDFRPVIVADARYRLPDGREGRTSASFLVGGMSEAGAPEPIALDRTMIREDVEAQLYRNPERV